MNAEPCPGAGTPGAAPVRRRRLLLVIAAAALAAGIGYGLWAWSRVPLIDPPDPDLASTDPGVAVAIADARAAVQATPRSAGAWGRLGMTLHVHDFFPEAERCYAQAGRLDPHDARWPYLQAVTLLHDKADPGPALGCLERAAALSGNVPAPRLRLGEALLEQGRLDEAEGQFRRALEQDGGDARAHLGLGRAALCRGDLPAGLRHLKRSLVSAPRVKTTHVLLAEVHHRLGDEPAEDEERRQLEQLPDDPAWPDPYLQEVEQCWVGVVPRVNRANELVRQGRAADAIRLMEQTAARYPDSVLARLVLGRLCNQAGESEAAERTLREAVRLQPDAFETQFELGVALEAQGQDQAAAECYRQAVRCQPEFGSAHHNLGRCLLRRGDRAGAIEAFRAAVRYRPNFAAAHLALGSLLADARQDAEALVHLRHAVRLNPADEDAKDRLERVRQRLTPPDRP